MPVRLCLPELPLPAPLQVHLFFGYGERAQYADVEEALAAMQPHLKAIQARCCGAVGAMQIGEGVHGR